MDFEIRGNRFSAGGRPLERERAEYFRLMALGWSSKAARRAVAVNCRTGVALAERHAGCGTGRGR